MEETNEDFDYCEDFVRRCWLPSNFFNCEEEDGYD